MGIWALGRPAWPLRRIGDRLARDAKRLYCTLSLRKIESIIYYGILKSRIFRHNFYIIKFISRIFHILFQLCI